jgi:hypothetical protein
MSVLSFPDRGGTGWRTDAKTWGEVDPTNLHHAGHAYWAKKTPLPPREVLGELGVFRSPELLLVMALIAALPARQYDKAWRTVAAVLAASPGPEAIAAFQIIQAAAPKARKGGMA